MDLINLRCAGLDVHKKTVVACARRVAADGGILTETRTFGTVTGELLALADWLVGLGVTHAAMESTGVYWKPVFHVLEGQLEVMVVNAQHIKRVPGRKTDVKDAEWIAQLLQYGLLRPSFVPPPPVRELRDLTRQRAQLVRDRATVVNRIEKVLEDANIKLAAVASDLVGVSGRAMLRAIVAGEADPAALAELARARLRGKRPELARALHGYVTDHHRFLLRELLGELDSKDAAVARFDDRIGAVMGPFAAAAARLRTIPGVGVTSSEVITAEVGTDMSRFPTAGHLASWAGLCPGNNQSGGKRRGGKTTKGSQWLRTGLVQVAWAAAHTKASRFQELYRRWAKRLGKKKALVAVAHKILVTVYHVLKDGTVYQERQVRPEAA